MTFFLLILIAASCLYVPFLSNSIIFDDHSFFAGLSVYDYAQVPLSLKPRQFPYFTLGFIQVLSGSIEANRIVSLGLHVSIACLIFLIVRLLIKDVTAKSDFNDSVSEDYRCNSRTQIISGVCALWFLLNPIAVYGAAYLAQRTILFATLFALISLWFYRRAFAENRTADIFTAALFYTMAVFSKEHAIMLPLAAVSLTALFEGSRRSHFKRILLYLILCLPAAITVLLASKHIVASSYEPDVGAMIPQMHEIALLAKPWGKWLLSIILQAGFFFDYLAFWMVPDVRLLSADMRFDFVDIWFSWWVFPKAFLFFLSPILAIYFLRKKGLIAFFCCGLLYCWFLFLTEVAAVRFQEPFVLYRSYLWAPGYVMMMVAVCARFSRRWLVIAAIPVFAIFFLLARERLTSLATEASVWKDAASKLVSPSLIGSDRIFYNRGRAYLQEKKYAEAIDDFSHTIQQSPRVSQAYYNRALAYYSLEKYPEAMADLNHALLLNENNAYIQYLRGLVFERRGCVTTAKRAFTASMVLGDQMAKMKLNDLAKNNPDARKQDQSLDDAACPAWSSDIPAGTEMSD